MIERAKQFLASRRGAYRAVFDEQGVYTKAVLRDLAKFCRANESTAHPDTHAAARLDGRREVWLRIAYHLHLTDEQLLQIYPPRSNP